MGYLESFFTGLYTLGAFHYADHNARESICPCLLFDMISRTLNET